MDSQGLTKEEQLVYTKLYRTFALSEKPISEISLEKVATEYLGLHGTEEALTKAAIRSVLSIRNLSRFLVITGKLPASSSDFAFLDSPQCSEALLSSFPLFGWMAG